jgi:hypothetical protein
VKKIKARLSIIIIFPIILISCGYMEESNFLDVLDSGDWWNTSYNYRNPVTIDNTGNASTLTDYQVRVTITNSSADFWSGIENDGRSIRFTDSSHISELYFWVEKFDYAGQSAIIWVLVPSIEASANTYIYIYYGNNSAVSLSSGLNTFLFFDDYEDNDVSDYTVYSSGGVQSSNDPIEPAGYTSSYSLEKINNSDPNGAWVILGFTMDTAANSYSFDGRIFRPSGYTGGASDRWAIEDSGFNGYGPILNHTGNTIAIEERTGGTGSALGSSVSYDPPEDEWYKFTMYFRTGGIFDFYYYSMDESAGDQVTGITDNSTTSFDRLTVHGGFEFLLDEVRIRNLSLPEPTALVGSQEIN